MEHKLECHFFENHAFMDGSASDLRQKAYSLWVDEWQKIYKQLGSQKLPCAEDFLSYDIINCLFSQGEIVGLTGHKFINLGDKVCLEMEYVKSLGDVCVEKIRALGVNRMMTFESFLVSPRFRKSNFPMPLSRTLFYLANNVFASTSAEGMLGAGRVDLKVGEMGASLGYNMISPNMKFRVFHCDVMLQLNKNVFHPDDLAWRTAQSLWESAKIHRKEAKVSPDQHAEKVAA